jgi:CysZ protein
MKEILATWPVALRFIFKDPINFMLFIIPAIIAVTLYAIVGGYFLMSAIDSAQALIFKYVISKEANVVLYYLVVGLLTFLFYLLVSWTFVLIIGMISAPFNDVISSRIEKKINGVTQTQDKSKTLGQVFSGLGKTLINELKKIFIILIMTAIAALLNFIPVLYPLAIVILALLMSSSYLDYSWSRHDLDASACFKDLFKNFFKNLLSGLMFLGLIAVPFINALVPAIATSYYTVLWTKRQQKKISES